MANLMEHPLRYRFLSESDAEYLYEKYTNLKPDYEEFCPTCGKQESPIIEYQCDCQLQLQLYKHYLNAGIGAKFHRMTWDDYVGDEAGKSFSQEYIQGADRF